MELSAYAASQTGLGDGEIEEVIVKSLEGRDPKKVLILPPDFTRYHSNAGRITNLYYHILTGRGARVDILPALGTHVAMTEDEAEKMYGDIPYSRFITHHWKSDTVTVGFIPGSVLHGYTDGLWNEGVAVEINRLVMDPSYDLILSVGQVVPHEVIGMSNHSKNLFVGVGGPSMIHRSHMIGAVCGLESMMGRDNTPVRRMFDYALEKFLSGRPIVFVLTVTTAKGQEIFTHGLFIGDTRATLEKAVALSQEKNINFVPSGIKKCVTFLEPSEFRTTWLGNKAIYRTRMAIADGGELIILAPGVCRFGEDDGVDRIIRKYGYTGRLHILSEFGRPENKDLRESMAAAAHLIHGSSDGRFTITYAVKQISKEEIESVGFKAADYDEMVKKYNPEALKPGYNMVEGEEVYFIPNPALGLWINRETFKG